MKNSKTLQEAMQREWDRDYVAQYFGGSLPFAISPVYARGETLELFLRRYMAR